MRLTFSGSLRVYRSIQRASITLGNGRVIYYDPCPKGFNDVMTDPRSNSATVTFTANKDGTNPRSVKTVGEPFIQQGSL